MRLTAGAGSAFVAEIVLARVMPDAPPYLFLDTPDRLAGWVALDRFLFSVVSLGFLAAGAVAGAAAKANRAAISVMLVSSCASLVGLLLQGVLWGTSETAQDLAIAVAWLGLRPWPPRCSQPSPALLPWQQASS